MKLTFSVDEFCVAHGISRAMFYDHLKRGDGPAIMKVGSRTMVSAEAAAAWRKQMEQGASSKVAAA